MIGLSPGKLQVLLFLGMDPLWYGKEAAFMWSIWHKAVAINE